MKKLLIAVLKAVGVLGGTIGFILGLTFLIACYPWIFGGILFLIGVGILTMVFR